MVLVTQNLVEPKSIAHVERNYTSASGTNYILPSDEIERERLALQHRLLKDAFGGRLVLFTIDFCHGGNVLDSGTGSATWILDAAQTFPPSVKLHAIDIEPGLFPVIPTSCHREIRFSINSITSLPKDWENTFTLVNQRLLNGGLQRTEWPTAIREIYHVLAPGGWVQLGETGSWKGGPVTEKHKGLMRALHAVRGLLLDCADHIPLMLEQAGFVNIHVDKRTIPLGQWAEKRGVDARDNFMGVFRAIKTPILKAGGLGYVSSEVEFDALMDNLEKEWDESPGSEIDFVFISAQKPGTASA